MFKHPAHQRLLARVMGSTMACGSLVACFGTSVPARSYYVLHGVSASGMVEQPIAGMVRVRNLDADTVFEKFQYVVRRNPYELQYNEDNVWAVKPSRGVADVVARVLGQSHRFAAVVRELGELRPNYILGGQLDAIEVYDSEDEWFAHLALTLVLTEFATGETLHTFRFDERRPLSQRTFAQATRAMSEMLSTAMDEFLVELEPLDVPRVPHSAVRAQPIVESTTTDDHDSEAKSKDETEDAEPADGTIFVPEKR
ncbi:MAG: hypothetical protein A2289_20160 [Deltaproteobacteria bacterium RIFOXYA12_FULL_58_15]|nr:MAG: hypothetical protein A2289_20160 [Deltaproteobacteria bacterium RIFOXYA12_FULL_58_15]OGR07163.1 MAG: hypothetical protein A2341_03460 [Deltaproteobacteria bacterium RIFOXYB12_FULL_58_9]